MRNRTALFAFALAGFVILFNTGLAFAQYKGSPVKKEKLISVIRSRQLQTREIVSTINSNGVDFKVDAIIEAELRGAGARPEVIAAAKANYRAAVSPVAASPAKPIKPGPGGKISSGKVEAPMSKDVIITLLNNGVADEKVRGNVNTRGVSFKQSAADRAEIRAAGGSVALVNLIDQSFENSSGNSNSGGTVVDPVDNSAAGQYDALVDKAVYQYDVLKNVNGSISALTQAIALNPNEARGYQLMGFSYLYGQKNFGEAEKYMQMAIDRGGSAVFRVFHDHGALMTDTCEGSLFVAKDTVRFESDNNVHTFETKDENIKEAKVAGKFAAMFNARAGAFKIALKTGDNDSKNYNFAPLTNDAAESKMIIRLIDKKKT